MQRVTVLEVIRIHIVKEQVGVIANLPGFAGSLQVRALHEQGRLKVDGLGLAILFDTDFRGFRDAVKA